MTELCPCKVGAKVASWPILDCELAILAIFIEIWTSNLFCPSFTLILRCKPNEKSIRPKLTIWDPKNHKNGHISKCQILAKFQSPKSLLLLHFSMNLSETFRIGINIDFAK